MNNNKVVNKQISLRTVLDIANYFEDYKERYEEIYRKENEKNKDKPFSERNYEYENGNIEVRYRIDFHNGQNLTESNYNWFVGNINNPRAIKNIEISLSNTYFTQLNGNDTNNTYNKVYVSVEFRDCGMSLKYSDVIVNVDATNQESEARNVYSTVMNMLEDNPERYDKTIKFRKIRMQSFTISIGIILSYILYMVLMMNKEKLTPDIAGYLNNKNVLIFGQWFVAVLLGNVASFWYILSVYRPLLPESRYAGYSSSTYKSVYKDDIADYIEHSEVHIGKFWDAEKRRNKIEKIYKVTNKVLLVQLLISIVLFFVLK